MAVTLRDIARQLNLSHATVSFVLNERHDVAIPETTRKRVMEVAREMGYRPNRAARALVMGRTQMLGIWIPSTRSAYYGELLDTLHCLARDHGYETILCGDRYGEEGRRPCDWPVDGVLAVDVPDALAFGQFPMNMPVMGLGAEADRRADHVRLDLASGSIEAVMHLIEKGCRRVAFLTPDKALDDAEGCHQAYQKIVRSAGLSSELIVCRQTDGESVRATMRAYIDSHGCPDGVFAASDRFALAAVRALADEGMNVPEHCRIVGFGNTPDSALTVPSLSTVSAPAEEMCRTAFDLLMARIKNPKLAPQTVTLPTKLVVRESTCA